VADANPLEADSVTWKREGFDMAGRTQQTFSPASRAKYLVVRNVTAEDSGEFVCVANNGIGEEVKNSSFLLVRCEDYHDITPFHASNGLFIPAKPVIDASPALTKAASDKGQTANLTCEAKGAPDVSFIWSRDGRVISDDEEEKYSVSEPSMLDR